jgi:hypothetical protein
MKIGCYAAIPIAVSAFAVADISVAGECPYTVGTRIDLREPWPKSTTWYGTEALAVSLPKDGIWPTTTPGSLIAVKLFWYSTEFQAVADGGFARTENIGFEARIERLDDGPSDAVISAPNWAGLGGLGDNWTMLTGIDFRSAGCWRITGEYQDQVLSFVVKTVHHDEWGERRSREAE